ncbi:hypothetical protein HY412_01650 [Candidatus Kaiserbacteria bacterium]|nr:hypothetical protein [Candidatus Kaiserbacteria bacterium]
MNGFHHLRARARATKGLESFPSRNKWKRLLDYLMYAVGIFAPIALVPQIIQLYTTKSATGLALPTWLLFVVVNLLWTTYGVVHKDKHILFANLFMALFNSIVVVGVLMYSDVL